MRADVLKRAGRLFLAIVCGIVVIALVEAAGHAALGPAPAEVTPAVLAVALAAWGLGTAVAVYLAERSPEARVLPEAGRSGAIAAAILGAFAVNALLTVPHPTWAWVAAPLVFAVGWFTGYRVAGGGPRRPDRAGSADSTPRPA